MLDKQFDNIIKEKLDNIQMNVPGSDWSVFSQKLKTSNQQMLDDEAFDQAILDKVSEPIITLPPVDWAGFNTKLQASKGNELTDNEFDSFVQDRLALDQTAVPSADWAVFSEKMKSANLSDSRMDHEIKNRLDDYTTNYNDTHWELLRTKLVELKRLRKNILSVKWYEGLIAILLFITYANFIAEFIHPETNKHIQLATVEKISTSSEILAGNESNNRLPKEIGFTTNTASTSSANKNKNSKKTTTRIAAATTSNVSIAIPFKKALKNASNNDEPVSTNSGGNTLNSDTTPPTSRNTSMAVSPRDYESDGLPSVASSDKISEPATKIASNDLASLNQLQSIAALNWEERKNPVNGEDFGFAVIDTDENDQELSKFHYHLYTGTNYQLITGPRDTLFGRALAENSSNSVFGIGVSKTLESIEIMGGFKYQQLSYNPKDLHEVLPGVDGEIYDYYLNKIEYQQLSIPLGFRWHHPLGEKLDLIAELGVTANFIVNSNYETLKDLIINDPSGPAPTPGPGNEEDFAAETRLSRKDLSKGLLQGGNLKQNLYASFNSGIGLQYSFTDQFGIYGTANLNQMIGSFRFAANTEKINSLGARIGIRYTPLK